MGDRKHMPEGYLIRGHIWSLGKRLQCRNPSFINLWDIQLVSSDCPAGRARLRNGTRVTSHEVPITPRLAKKSSQLKVDPSFSAQRKRVYRPGEEEAHQPVW